MRRRITAGLLALALSIFSVGTVDAHALSFHLSQTNQEEATDDVSSEETTEDEATEATEDEAESTEEATEEVTQEDAEEESTEEQIAAPERVEPETEEATEVIEEEVSEEEAEEEELPEDYNYGLNHDGFEPTISDLSEDALNAAQTATLPSSYKSSYVTSVKNQGDYGTCWAFSAIAASEASIISEGYGTTSNTNLSEWQLAYFTFHTAVDPLGLTSGDTVSNSDYLDNGGNQYIATATLASWKGPVAESKAKYTTVSSNKNASLSSSLAYSSDSYHLENAYWIPVSSKSAVKQMIVKRGAVVMNYYASTSSTYYNSKKGAYYCPYNYTSNHAITVVGWDDNYSASNFSKKPSGNGAWLVKNSWGTSWGNSGYFWLSYYDQSIDDTAFAYDYGRTSTYKYNYQYDGGIAMGIYGYNSSTVWNANIYRATSNQVLKAVGYYTADTGYKTTVYIYRNPSSGNPKSGTLVASKTVTDTYAGYHTLKLDSSVYLLKDEKFSIVIKYTDPTGKEAGYIVDESYSNWFTSTSTTHSGQSYSSGSGNSWYDENNDSSVCRIKAFTIALTSTSEYTNAKKFATRMYTKCLGRDPESAGLEYWTVQLATQRQTGAQAAYGFVFSKEYTAKNKSDGDYIKMLYKLFMDRTYDTSGLNYWRNLLTQGVSRVYVFNGFATSNEFKQICKDYGITAGSIKLTQARDQNVNLTKYVNRVYKQVLGRNGDESGLNYWCGRIIKGTSKPEDVAIFFLSSSEFTKKNYSNTAYVKICYRTFMGREADTAGLNYWVGLLKNGKTRSATARAFAATPEFKKIVASFGL